MAMSATMERPNPRRDVWKQLEDVCRGEDLGGLAARLGALRATLEGDLSQVDQAIEAIGDGSSLAEKTARHLLDGPGKRLRPLCTALASRIGTGFSPAAQSLAVAVELVHAATLLHDDVVDLGDMRRGTPTARVVYGNAASIFGGDWLLCEALRRIQAAAIPGLMERAIGVIQQMVVAETMQLARRGKVDLGRDEYEKIALGKTASLFGWAAYAGARAGGVAEEACLAVEAYGIALGLSFQIVDDLLDVAGDPAETGKSALSDLREGKMTLPLIIAAERDAGVRAALTELAALGRERSDRRGEGAGRAEDPSEPVEPPAVLVARVGEGLSKSGAVEASMEIAAGLARNAVANLQRVPACEARSALEAVAIATVRRRR